MVGRVKWKIERLKECRGYLYEERGCINLSSSNWMDRQLQKREACEILHLLCIGTSFPNTS